MRINDLKTRESLLSRIKDWQDSDSWQEFFHTYEHLVRHVARRAGLSPSESEEVVQTTFVTIAKRIGQFKKRPGHWPFRGWLLNTARWRIADQFRKRLPMAAPRLEPEDSSPRTSVMDRVPDPASLQLESLMDQEWEMGMLEVAQEKARRLVEPEVYQLFDLHAVQGWCARKVAARFGVPLSRVYAAKYRIAELIKKEVKQLQDNF